MDRELIEMFANYSTGSVSVSGNRISVWLHDKRDLTLCCCGHGASVAAAFADAKAQMDFKTKDRGDLDEPCGHCGARTKADVEFLCTSWCRAHVPNGEPCHGETPCP